MKRNCKQILFLWFLNKLQWILRTLSTYLGSMIFDLLNSQNIISHFLFAPLPYPYWISSFLQNMYEREWNIFTRNSKSRKIWITLWFSEKIYLTEIQTLRGRRERIFHPSFPFPDDHNARPEPTERNVISVTHVKLQEPTYLRYLPLNSACYLLGARVELEPLGYEPEPIPATLQGKFYLLCRNTDPSQHYEHGPFEWTLA